MILNAVVWFRQETVFGIHPHIGAIVLIPVPADRADLDTTPAGREVPAFEFFRSGSTGVLVGKPLRVPFTRYRRNRAD